MFDDSITIYIDTYSFILIVVEWDTYVLDIRDVTLCPSLSGRNICHVTGYDVLPSA